MQKMTMTVRCLATMALLAASGSAQQYPSQQRGLSADTAYQTGAIDNVNLFNGAMTLQIPIGPTYPVGPNLSFRLSLSYSSVGWDYQEDVMCFDPKKGMMHTYILPIESPHANAGFGWRLVLGKIVDAETTAGALKYISSDGGEHGFYDDLHPDYPNPPQANTTFSHDSTYLRMRYYPSGSMTCTAAPGGSLDCRQIELPDGTIHEFHDFSTVPGEPEWLVTRMMDRFDTANWVAIDYSTANEWNISDSHGRAHKVLFSGGRVSQIRLAAFNTATPATYTLTQTVATLDRLQYLDRPPCADPPTITAPLLTQLTLPDGSAYAMSYLTSTLGDRLSGGIDSLRLPTGGELAWSYEPIDFISQDPQENGPDYVRTAYGVDVKEMFTTFDLPSSKIGEWSYDYVSIGNPSAPGDPMIVPCFHTTTVTDPLGNTTVHYFDSADVSPWQYGLPFRRCDDQGNFVTAPYPSQEIYQGDPATGTKLRSVFVEYGSDGVLGGLHQEKNHRLTLRKVVYHDADTDREKQVAYSDFDGLGHFRTMVATGDFVAGDSRTMTTEYNSANGELVVDPDTSSTAGSTFVMPGASDPWVLETFTERRVTESGDTSVMEACFDTTNGFLERTRTLAGASRSGIDLLQVFDQEEISGNGTGRVATERRYGGDPGGLGTGSLCALTLPAEAQSQLEHTYDAGALESSRHVDPCDGSHLLQVADHDVDLNTGLARVSRDAAGVATSFVYDSMARLIREQPQDDAWTITTYDLPGPASSDPPELTVQQCPNGNASCSGAPLAWRHSVYDGLGRLTQEEIEYPSDTGITTASREFSYNGMGWRTSTSLWNAPSLTTDVTHDRFGRMLTITPPDPSLAPTVYVYRGEQRIERSDKVATGAGGTETYVCYREDYDSFGRLISVAENLASDATGHCGPGAAGLRTSYAYDEADRLTEVCSMGGTGSCVQQRFFDYDGRGYLLSEQHPEIGPSGNGTASYTYDASANVLSKDISGTTDFALRYTYDPANRLIAVDEVDSPTTIRPIKSFQYARGNDGTDLKAGKLVLSKRVNWVDIIEPLDTLVSGTIPVTISQAYRYEGESGRVSQRQTRYHLAGTTYAFITGFSYDDLGNMSQIDYPRCLHHGCVGDDPPRTVDFGHTRGYLSSVPGFASSLTYQRGGMLHKVSHTNSVVETIAVDPTYPFDRPYRISTSGVTNGNWNTGVYAYDGSGNIRGIDDESFRYDRMSRLITGQVDVGGVTKTQSLTYDAYGNLLSLTTDGTTQPTATSSTTNRLTEASLSPVYDAGGNLADVTLGAEHYLYTYDPLNMMKHLQSTTDQARVFLYDADDERVMTFDCALVECDTQTSRLTTTIRGLDAKVLRVYNLDFGESWEWVRDYVHRGGQLLAAVEADDTRGEVTRHFHLDHLGSPRQITDEAAAEVAFHTYYPFGGEATDPGQDEFQLKFTGHERDGNGSAGVGLLDYMHARYFSPETGRFLSMDIASATAPNMPQSWNRYAYVNSNPLGLIDPDGLLQRYANGELVKDLGSVSGRKYGDLFTRWRVQDVTLFADDLTPIQAHTVLSGTEGVGDIRDVRYRGIVSRPNTENEVCANCHGFTFADGKYWIEPSEVDKILQGDNYNIITGEVRPGDVAIYRDRTTGKALHSATVSAVDDQGRVTVVGLSGLDTAPRTGTLEPQDEEDFLWGTEIAIYRKGTDPR